VVVASFFSAAQNPRWRRQRSNPRFKTAVTHRPSEIRSPRDDLVVNVAQFAFARGPKNSRHRISRTGADSKGSLSRKQAKSFELGFDKSEKICNFCRLKLFNVNLMAFSSSKKSLLPRRRSISAQVAAGASRGVAAADAGSAETFADVRRAGERGVAEDVFLRGSPLRSAGRISNSPSSR